MKVGVVELSETNAVVNHLIFEDNEAVQLAGNIFRKQLLRYGEWVHPNDPSRKLVITKELVRKMIENFKRGVLDKVPVPDTHTRSALANTGYVIGLEEGEDGLYGILKIEDEVALEKIRKGLIPGISVSFTENYIVKETGENVGPVLLHAALVDNPYIKGLKDFEPVTLGDEGENVEHVPYVEQRKEVEVKMTREQLITALRTEHGIDVVALQDQVKELEKAQADLKAATDALEAIKKTVGDVVQLSDDLGVVDAVRKLVDEAKKAEKQVTELADRVKALEEDARKRDARDAVREIVSKGLIAPADAEHYEKLYLSDKVLFENIVKTLKPVVDLSERGVETAVQPGATFDAQAEIQRLVNEYLK